MVNPQKLTTELRKYAQQAAVANKVTNPAPMTTSRPSMSSLKPRMPASAQPAMAPSQPSLQTTPGNMTMKQGPMPATAPTAPPAMPITPRSDVGVRGGVGTGTSGGGRTALAFWQPNVGPLPKIAEDASSYLKQRLKDIQPAKPKLPKPPSLKPPEPPAPMKSFTPKKPRGYGGRAGMTQGTT